MKKERIVISHNASQEIKSNGASNGTLKGVKITRGTDLRTGKYHAAIRMVTKKHLYLRCRRTARKTLQNTNIRTERGKIGNGGL